MEEKKEKVEWVVLREIVFEIFAGSHFSKSQMTSDTAGIPCIHYGEIYKSYNIWTNKVLSFLNTEACKKPKFCEKGDLLITKVGENKKDIAKPLAYLGDKKVAIDGATFVLRSG